MCKGLKLAHRNPANIIGWEVVEHRGTINSQISAFFLWPGKSVMIIPLVKVAITMIFVTKTSSTDLEEEQPNLTQSVYYDCGSCFFYENPIQDMLDERRMNTEKIALPFTELLYNLDPNYRKINIPERLCKPKSLNRKWPRSNPYVIIDQMWKIIDLVAEMKNGHYIKCKRFDDSAPESQNIDPNDYGYECGHDIFSHEIVQRSASLARSDKIRNTQLLSSYYGPLYSPELDYKIYPLSREKYQNYPGKRPENTYFVVISRTGKMIDVIAELMAGDFIKCVRTTKVPSDIESDQDFRFGYLCGLEFFGTNHVKLTAKLAEARNLHRGRHIFPKEYNSNSFKGY
ncbi:hypothetical protein EPUL_005565, partial [Erysiphe pulchra]